jgi:hypothetical protein
MGLPLRRSRDGVDIECGKVPSTSSSVYRSQMRSDAVVEPSLGDEVEDALERDDGEHRAAVVEPVDLGVYARVGRRMLRECSIGMQTVTLRHREVSAV